ncbi:hypothetical protein LOTGIDRAFT_216911 [Lottia gigantea]|uniref:GPI ethanolamine phosphate transferase 2 C-terminal domain-containing protein n=1 Tax=Lottia gigantea TaxID=225164 RepID=V3ZM16_LOTGI|nr:hypothetical protein LOTGIDRAFT_216911 [Lottia gigantea]ESO92393.1 hypothetical protein LOTGIDRAFT_216911 [Lottia gigantea]
MSVIVFYLQGNSNSLSTIDVSAGYIGLESYQPVFTAILMICSTYSCLTFWFITLVKHIVIDTHCKEKMFEAGVILMCIKTLPITIYTLLVTVQRYHLFVWTVFSPKVLYEGALLVLVSVISVLLVTTSVFLPICKIKS